jgi:hypothetical protein
LRQGLCRIQMTSMDDRYDDEGQHQGREGQHRLPETFHDAFAAFADRVLMTLPDRRPRRRQPALRQSPNQIRVSSYSVPNLSVISIQLPDHLHPRHRRAAWIYVICRGQKSQWSSQIDGIRRCPGEPRAHSITKVDRVHSVERQLVGY